MTTKDEVIAEAINQGLEVIYPILRQLKEELDIGKEIYMVKYGIDIKFDVRRYIEKKYIEGESSIIMNRQRYTWQAIKDEIEKREDIARKILMDYIDQDEPMHSR
jgi:hypothetical protein